MSEIQTLKQKLSDWKDRLSGDGPHAISRQISAMSWRSAFYRSVNESRLSLPKDADGEPLANGSLHELLHEGYITIHTVLIRRLLDTRTRMNSLYKLIHDIENNATLLTRENMLKARGLEYNYELSKTAAIEEARAEAQEQSETAYMVSRAGWGDAECWHMLCDELCGTEERQRSKEDCPNKKQFTDLRNALTEEGRAAISYVNNYIAHAAPEDQRQALANDENKLTLEKLWSAERAIVRAASFISRCIIEGVHVGGVPIPQFDQFRYLDQAFAPTNARPAMERAWDEHTRDISACRNWSWREPLIPNQ